MKSGHIGTNLETSKIEVIGDAQLSLEEAAIASAPDYKLWPKMAEVVSHVRADQSVELAIRSSGPWNLPNALPGQRIRFHIAQDLIGVATVHAHRDHTTVLHVEPSLTSDPATTYLRDKVQQGDKLIVSGPFGRG
jgi:hypothetical protein